MSTDGLYSLSLGLIDTCLYCKEGYSELALLASSKLHNNRMFKL